jgi:Protein of unknown function (DUF3999)
MNPAWGALALLGALMAQAKAEDGVFRFARDIQRTGGAQQQELLAVELDSPVYAATQNRFADLRLFDAERREVPFLLEQSSATRTETVREWRAAPVRSLSRQGAEGMEIEIRLPNGSPAAQELRLITLLTDFERRVKVFGSGDGKVWHSLVEQGLIFDYSRYIDLATHEIPLPANVDRYFRLSIDATSEIRDSAWIEMARRLRDRRELDRVQRSRVTRVPFRIDRVEFGYDASRQLDGAATKASYPLTGFNAETPAGATRTIVSVTTRREPLTAFSLLTSSRNFSRAVSVEALLGEGSRATWREIATATVSNIDFRTLHREQLTVSFPEHREDRYRIIIDNQDSPPLELTGITATGNVYRLLYLAQPGSDYRLAYGSERAAHPRYDTAAVSQVRAEYPPAIAQLGPEMPAAGTADDSRPAWSGLLNDQRFLVGVIVVMTVVLGWALLGAGRRIQQLPKDR